MESRLLDADARKALLDRVVEREVAMGATVESRMDVMAVLVPAGQQRRVTLAIDEMGRVLVDGVPAQPTPLGSPLRAAGAVSAASTGSPVMNVVRQHPLAVLTIAFAVILAAPCLIRSVARVPTPASTTSSTTPPPASAPPDLQSEAAHVTALLNFKAALRSSGAWPKYVDGAELDTRMRNRVVLRVTSTFFREPRHEQTAFVRTMEGAWDRYRGEAGAKNGRSLVLMVNEFGERKGGSTVMGLAEMED